MDRDALLAAALGAAVLTGCTSDDDPAPTPRPGPPTGHSSRDVDPDLPIVLAWWVSEHHLQKATPATYVPLRAARAERIAAMAERLLALGGNTNSPGPKPIADLAKAERDASARYLVSLARVTDPAVAVLGAELAAGARQHATVLALLPGAR